MHPWHDLSPGEHVPHEFHAVIEIPLGSSVKYELDKASGIIKMDRVLYSAVYYPANYGFIPQSLAEDHDPLDVLVLGVAPSFPGCLVTVRLVGVLRALQLEAGRTIRNDRLIAVGETPVNRPRLRELHSLDAEQLRDIEHFFESYNRRQGREFRISSRGGRRAAEAVLARGLRAFARARGR
jgi:inorganic pyrophosphatase